jgi:hypothetical protein
VDLGRLQERQPSRHGDRMGCREEDRPAGAFQQEALCGRRLLRREQGYPHGRPLHHGSGLAGAFRGEHVHPADGGGAGELHARLRRLQRLQGEGRELSGTRPPLRDGRPLQHHQPRAGHRQHLVRRRDEEGHVLHDELLPAAEGHRLHALLGQHRPERPEHGDLLRPFRHRQDDPFHRPQAPADRRRRARLGRQRRLQL